MAGSMQTSVKMPPELLEMIGAFQAAGKEVKAELKDLEKEAKQLAKTGGSLSKEKAARRNQLQDKQIELDQKKKDAKEQEAKINNSLSKRASSFHSEALRLGSDISRGNVAGVASFAKKHAVPALNRLGLKRAALKVGSAASSVASAASVAAAPIAIGAAVGYGAVSIMKNYYESRAHEIEGDGVAMANMAMLLASDVTGTKYSASFAENMLKSTNAVGAATQSKMIESSGIAKLRQSLGFGMSRATADIDTRAKIQQQKVQVLAKKFGAENLSALSLESIKDSEAGQTHRNVLRYGVKQVNWYSAHYALGHFAAVSALKWHPLLNWDLEKSGMHEFSIKQQGKRLETEKKIAERSAGIRERSPEIRDNEKTMGIYFQAMNEMRYNTAMQWNKF